MVTLQQLQTIAPHAPAAALDPLNAAMEEFQISTPLRQAAFLAQCAYESEEFHALEEKWGPTSYQLDYEGARRLGNVVPGDGYRFRGRGYIQLTGRTNYTRCGGALGLDLVGIPDLAARPDIAARAAGWYWQEKALNALADDGDFVTITTRINGGLLGLAQRKGYYERALTALGAVQACGA